MAPVVRPMLCLLALSTSALAQDRLRSPAQPAPTATAPNIVAPQTTRSGDRSTGTSRARPAARPATAIEDVGMLPSQPYVVELQLDDAVLAEHAGPFVLEFGDGHRARVRSRLTRHDYRTSMRHQRPRTVFTARLLDRSGAVVDTHEITIESPIAMSRGMGFAQAEVNPPQATDVLCPFEQSVEITNHEDTPVVYERFYRVLQSCTPGQPAIVQQVSAHTALGDNALAQVARQGYPDRPLDGVQPRSPGRIALRPGETARFDYTVPCEEIVDVCVVSWELVGRTDDGRKAYAAFHGEVARNPLREESVDAATARFLDQLTLDGALDGATRVNSDTLRTLRANGTIDRTAAGWEMSE